MSLSEFGDYLKHAREVHGMSLRELEHVTRIRIKYLTAIEEGDVGVLQSDIQLYGFVRSYAQQVGLDPAPTGRQSPVEPGPVQRRVEWPRASRARARGGVSNCVG